MSKGILILVAYICEFFICCYQPATTKALELGSSTGMDYVYFVLIHTVVVVYTAWCWCLEGESLIYTTQDYLLHIVEYIVFPILDLREMLWFALLSFCWFKSYDIFMTILKFPHWRRLKQVIWFQLGWGCRCNRLGLLGMELCKQGRQVSTSQQEVVPLTSVEGNESLENLARESQSADFSPALGSENFQGGHGEQSLEHLCTVCLDAPKDSFFDPCGHRCTCYSCGMRYYPSSNGNKWFLLQMF